VKGHRDLRRTFRLGLLCAGLALLISLPGLSLAFAAPLLLFLPGYALTAASFGRRQLERPQLLLLSVALSLAVLVLGALLLNYLGGIHPGSWAVLELLVVYVACKVAASRRGKEEMPKRPPLPRPGKLGTLMLAGAAAATVVAVTISASAAPNGDALGFTQLWVLPKASSDGGEAVVGVRSQEQRATDFDLRVRLGADQVVKRSFRLAPGEERQVQLQAPPGSEGEVPVTATLLRHNRPYSVYRRVQGSLTAPEQAP
jgi:uncharacterized membrane protein